MTTVQITNYPLVNTTVKPYVYTCAFQDLISTPTTFTGSNIVTDTVRAFYGYSSTSNITAVEFRIKAFVAEVAAASTANVQAFISMTYDNTAYNRLSVSSYNMITPLRRAGSYGTALSQFLAEPCNLLFLVKDPTKFATSTFNIVMNNATTGAALSTAEYMLYEFEWIEYVSQL